MSGQQQQTQTRFLRIREVQRLTGLSRSGIYHLMQSGDFPSSVKLTQRTVAWVESEVTDWIEARLQRRQR